MIILYDKRITPLYFTDAAIYFQTIQRYNTSMSRKRFSDPSEGRDYFEHKRKDPDNSAVREVREAAAVCKDTWVGRSLSVGRTK